MKTSKSKLILNILLYILAISLFAHTKKIEVSVGVDFGTSQIKYGVYNDKYKLIDSISPYVQVNADGNILVNVDVDELDFSLRPFKIKHLLDFDESKKNHKFLPFPVISINRTNAFETKANNKDVLIKCESIITRILNLIKSLVEEKLPVIARSVVIAISEVYEEKINDILFRALDKSMFDEVHLIRTPQAFSLGYRRLNEAYSKNLVLFDMGASKVEVTAVRITHDQIKIPNTFFNNSIGGDHFDYKAVEHFAKAFKKKANHDVLNNLTTKSKLLFEISNAKLKLENELDVPIEIKSHEIDFKSYLGFDKFDKLNQELFRECETMLDIAFRRAFPDGQGSPTLLAIGGSTKLTKVKSLLERFSNKKGTRLEIITDPIEIVYGASIYATKKTIKNQSYNSYPIDFSVVISAIIGLLTLIIIVRKVVVSISREELVEDHQEEPNIMEEIRDRQRLAAEAFRELVEHARFFNELGGLGQNTQKRGDTATEAEIQTLQVRLIQNEEFSEYLGRICIICRDEFKLGDPIVVLPCSHAFHSENNTLENGCVGIQAWLRDHHNICPVDRQLVFRTEL